jgi:hypothetical protein
MGSPSSAGPSGDSPRAPANNSGAESDASNSNLIVEVQKKITQLNSPAQINSFFKDEAVRIPNLRNYLYSDATSKLLATKGIRVVNQSGDVSGGPLDKSKYIYSDDGIKFTRLNIVKKK